MHPYGLIHHRGALYLVARDGEGDKIKHYKVDRVEAVEVGSALFVRPQGFRSGCSLCDPRSASTIARRDRDGRGPVRPHGERAYVLESERHKGQRLTTQQDGGVVAEFRVSSTEELKSWVLGFGKKAVVLEPETLRREIAEAWRARPRLLVLCRCHVVG